MLRLLVLFLLVCMSAATQSTNFSTSALPQPSGALCSHHFVKQDLDIEARPSVRLAQTMCASLGNFTLVRLRDIVPLYSLVSQQAGLSARSFRFFAASGDACMTVGFSAVKISPEHSTFQRFEVDHQAEYASQSCQWDKIDLSVIAVVCVADTCTLPQPSARSRTTPDWTETTPVAGQDSCADLIPRRTYNRHKFFVIVAGIASGLVMCLLLVGLLLLSLKHRRLSRCLKRLSSPPPAPIRRVRPTTHCLPTVSGAVDQVQVGMETSFSDDSFAGDLSNQSLSSTNNLIPRVKVLRKKTPHTGHM